VREVEDTAAAFHAMGAALRSSLTRQAALEQERRFFISAIAHDLRTPLFALRGYLSGLEKGLADTPQKAAHYISICQEKADALERLIADLFAYSRLEYLEQLPQRAPLDFNQLAAKSIDTIRWQADERHISISVKGPANSSQVLGDPAFLTRALGNLLDNALRYTPDGGEIELSWSQENQLLKFSVADSGPGIDDHDLPHLFDPLYRAETSRSRQSGGAGLGLTIARRILQAHGGDLVAVNRAGGGARFIGSFPG
jgi:signal transduction histidine kinase